MIICVECGGLADRPAEWDETTRSLEAEADEVDNARRTRAQVRQEVLRKSMDLLARREHSRFELHRKLALRRFDNQLIDEVIERLVAEHLCSDERFAGAFVRSRVGRGHGPVKIRADLRQRGVDDALVAEIVAGEDDVWIERARDVLQRRFGLTPRDDGSTVGDFSESTTRPVPRSARGAKGRSFGGSVAQKEEARQVRFLAGRGFTQTQIRAAMRSVR